MLITIQELLVRCGFPKDAKAKLVRHKDHRQNVYDLYRFHRDKFEDYQAIQSKPVFDKLDYIVSFIGEDAFAGCTSLQGIYYGENTPSAVRGIESDGISNDDAEEVARYNLSGRPCSPNEKGVQIIVYSNFTTKTVILE